MKKRITSFTAGFAAAVLTLALGATALAAGGKVSYNFANVALDGETKITAGADITAANGQKVPGTILFTDSAGGKTNYLPIRAVSELLGVEIGYDSATKTVLLGKQSAAPASSTSGFTAAEMAGALRGDTALIQSRGGTLLPDSDPSSYAGINEKVYKVFLDRNGQKRVEYFVGNPNTLHASDAGLLGDLTADGDYKKTAGGSVTAPRCWRTMWAMRRTCSTWPPILTRAAPRGTFGKPSWKLFRLSRQINAPTALRSPCMTPRERSSASTRPLAGAMTTCPA